MRWWRRLARSVEYRVGWDYTLEVADPNDFTAAIPSGKREWLTTRSSQIDVSRLLRNTR